MGQDSGWNVWMRRHVPGWAWVYWKWFYASGWCRAKLFEMRHGFDYRDCWSFDYAMAKWAAPRLRYLASIKCGAPHGYESIDITLDSETNFDLWREHINRAAKFFEDVISHEDSDYHDGYQSENERLKEEQKWVFTWMAEWWRALWD